MLSTVSQCIFLANSLIFYPRLFFFLLLFLSDSRHVKVSLALFSFQNNSLSVNLLHLMMISLITTLNLYHHILSLPALCIGYHQAFFNCIFLWFPKNGRIKLSLIWVCLYSSLNQFVFLTSYHFSQHYQIFFDFRFKHIMCLIINQLLS